MANVSFANIDVTFNSNLNNYITPSGGTVNSLDNWSWFINFNGTGAQTLVGGPLTYSGDTITGGTITEASIDTTTANLQLIVTYTSPAFQLMQPC